MDVFRKISRRARFQERILIIHAEKQNYTFAIDLAHISIAKFGWLRVAPTHNDARYAHNCRRGVPLHRPIGWNNCRPQSESQASAE